MLQLTCVIILLLAVTNGQFGQFSFDRFQQPTSSDYFRFLQQSYDRLTRQHHKQVTDHLQQQLQGAVSMMSQHMGPAFHTAQDSIGSHSSLPEDDFSVIMDAGKEPVIMAVAGGNGKSKEPATPNVGLQPVANLFSMFGGVPQRWWNGPNVCVVREDTDDIEKQDKPEQEGLHMPDEAIGAFNMHLTSCKELRDEYECTTIIRSNGIRKTVKIHRSCCYGFRRLAGEFGCKEIDLRSLEQTVNDLRGQSFLDMVTSAKLLDKLQNENLTVFMPSDDAVEEYQDDLEQTNSVEFYLPESKARRKRLVSDSPHIQDIVLGHMVSGFLDTAHFVDEQILYSENSNSSIRMNIFTANAGRILTANCARVTAVDNYATNGVVHVVDEVLTPVTKTVADIISSDPQFSILKAIVGNSDFLTTLREPGQFTLLAPTDAAFNALNQTVKDKLLRGEGCVMKVLKNLLLPNVICSNAISHRAQTQNLLDEFLVWEQTKDDKMFVDGVQIVARDIMGTNGVIHILDGVLIPQSALSFSEFLQEHNLTDFLALLSEAQLLSFVNTMENVTLLAPTNNAVEKLPQSVVDMLKSEPEKLREVLLYHVVGPDVQACGLSNDQLMKTKLAGKSVRVNLYTSNSFFEMPAEHATIQCAPVIKFDKHACGGVIHVVDRVLLPPAGNVLDTLKGLGNFTILLQLIEKSKLQDELTTGETLTLLAPSDAAFYNLPEETLSELLQNEEKARHLVKQHVLQEMLCCAGITENVWFLRNQKPTLAGNGNTVHIRRNHHGKIHAGHAQVVHCDDIATNGVIHTINKVLLPKEKRPHVQPVRRFGLPGLEEFFWF